MILIIVWCRDSGKFSKLCIRQVLGGGVGQVPFRVVWRLTFVDENWRGSCADSCTGFGTHKLDIVGSCGHVHEFESRWYHGNRVICCR